MYDQKRNNKLYAQKVHILFGCALLTRGEILHGGYGGSLGCTRLSGTFHTGAYDYMENDICKCNYIANKDGWQKYCYEKVSLNANKISPISILECNTLKNEVRNIPTLLQTFYAFPENVLEVPKK